MATMAEGKRQYVEYIEGRDNPFDHLAELGVDVNAGGFAGPGLDKEILDKFGNTGGSQILNNVDDLNALLNPGIFDGKDVIYAGAGNDIAFGDHVTFVKGGVTLDGWEALQAAVAAAGGDGSDKESVYRFISEHPDFVSSLPEDSERDQPDLLVGGAGDDILAGMGGGDVLLGDGDDVKTAGGVVDQLHTLLGGHAQGSDLTAGAHDLVQSGKVDEIHNFVDKIEGAEIEHNTDGDDYLFGVRATTCSSAWAATTSPVAGTAATRSSEVRATTSWAAATIRTWIIFTEARVTTSLCIIPMTSLTAARAWTCCWWQ